MRHWWIGLLLLSIVVGATGLVLDFPNFGQGRGPMQLVNVVHAVASIIYVALALGHIYMGTVGVEGAYDSMRIRGGDGSVDEAWAKDHHEYWYDEVKAGRIPAQRSQPIPPASQRWYRSGNAPLSKG